jgi:hypothetical protein
MPIGSEFLKATASNTASLQSVSTVATQANVYAYNIGMIALGIAGMTLNFLFFRAKLIPRWIAVWGLVGYAVLVCGMAADVLGSGLGLTLPSIPGGLWEVFVGGWLIIRGFNPSAFASPATIPAESAATHS